ncbi:MAG TPA: crossover junction endodeoxyribonuclease RuvC [Candidatus Acetothermia bacterium]|nr:crossover junction endodeoxyribonuclease RuvC [Candidatus Acetothermia bacterium]
MRVLGVDPGLAACGYGVVEESGEGLRPLACGTVRTSSQAPLPSRLGKIYRELHRVVEEYEPDAVAVEEVYLARNAPSAMLTAQVVGVIKLLAEGRALKSYAPREIKKWITGSGSAPKDQMLRMMEHLLSTQDLASDHAADALAVAVCALFDEGR